MPENEWQCWQSPTLGKLEDTPKNIWGTREYQGWEGPAVFMGCYSLKDFMDIKRHIGKKAILWCGSDITRLKAGWWLDSEGKIKVTSKPFAQWLNLYCDNYCENQVEFEALKKLGIYAKIVLSFLGDVTKFQISFKPGNKLYTSVSGDNFKLYGWDKIPKLAFDNSDIEFHCYGSDTWDCVFSNVKVHGRVSKEQMNEEIKYMQGALRLTKFDGFSEILAKSVLMGQWPVSLIPYPHMLLLKDIAQTLNKTEPNYKGQEFYRSVINQFPWTQTKK